MTNCRSEEFGGDLKSANFEDTDLTSARLYFCDLAGANLRGANLQNANLYVSHLPSANLMDAIGLTDQQVASACGGPNTALSAGIQRPQKWDRSGREE